MVFYEWAKNLLLVSLYIIYIFINVHTIIFHFAQAYPLFVYFAISRQTHDERNTKNVHTSAIVKLIVRFETFAILL